MRIIQNHHVLAVHDVRASARFYVDALGFETVAQPDGWIFVRRDECMIMLGECPDDMHPSELGCHNYFSYLRVDDVDAYHASILASGLAPKIGVIAEQPWGMREFALTTPDGHRITVGQIIAASPDAYKRSSGKTAMSSPVAVRALRESDYAAWLPLWNGYNAFYGREGPTALDPRITRTTWNRFFDPSEPVFALVAESEGEVLGLTHFLYHRSTTRIELTCYLQDLFTAQEARGQGVGRALIEAVYKEATRNGVKRVYWQTQGTNTAGRLLYDKVAKHLGFIVYSHDA